MVTIARVVEKMVRENPSLEISLAKGIISYSKLARYLRGEVEKETGKQATDSAIIVALKRLREKSEQLYERKQTFYGLELNTNSNLMEITIGKTDRLPRLMKKMYELPELEEGCVLNAINGNHQTTFVFSERLEKKIKGVLEGERKVIEMKGLAQLSIRFDKKMFDTPGFIVYVLKELTWNSINIIEVVSTYTELIVVVEKEKLMKAYGIVQRTLF